MTLQSIDHVMIAVHDLESATNTYASLLGLVATGSGDHPGRGTRNRIIVLDSCYLELIALQPDVPSHHWLARFLAGGEGLVRVALATADLEQFVEAMRSRGVAVNGPTPGSLVAPDGVARAWKTAFAGHADFDDWQLPFLIEHDSSGEERRRRLAYPEAPTTHPLGARDVPRATIAVSDFASGSALYHHIFGLDVTSEHVDEMLDARTANLALDQASLVLAAPRQIGSGPISRGLATRGDGLFSITISVDDLQGAVNGLRSRGAHVRVHEPQGVLVSAQLDSRRPTVRASNW